MSQLILLRYWAFLFLGANIDAIGFASRCGIDRRSATNFKNDAEGIKMDYETLSKTMCCLRENQEIDENWEEEIKYDYKKRSKEK